MKREDWIVDHGQRFVKEEALVREIERLFADMELINWAIDYESLLRMIKDIVEETDDVQED